VLRRLVTPLSLRATLLHVAAWHPLRRRKVAIVPEGAPLVIGSHYSGVRLTTASVSAWVKACGFDPKQNRLTTESRSWAVDPKTGVKKALTSNGEWFDTFEFGSKNGIATQSGDEDDTFAADAPLADAAFGKWHPASEWGWLVQQTHCPSITIGQVWPALMMAVVRPKW
jgi:hypothetical protein